MAFVVIDNHVVTSLHEKESGFASCSGTQAPAQCHPASGAALVMQYVDDRSQTQQSAAKDPAAELAARVKQLESRLSSLMTYTGQLEETIRQMQVGFRRHRSERVDPNQLTMALSAGADAAQVRTEQPCLHGDAPVAQCDNAATSQSETTTAHTEPCDSQGDTCRPPAARKRHRHGRRKVRVIPQLIVQILPAKVLLEGLQAYKQIGHEDASVIGYRRGGPVELVMRRPKFVRLEAQPLESGAVAESVSTADSAGERGPARAEKAQAPASGQPVEIFEHEFLSAPQDPTFAHNPFVDGAVVRYFPQPTGVGNCTAKVLIAEPPERPLPKGMADASLLAHLFVDKQGRHLPYHRQANELEGFGFPISRGTMASWQFECGKLVAPLVDAMWKQALDRSWFAMDATGTAIRGSPQYERGHVFVLVAEGQSILFRFSSDYNGATVNKLFGDSTATILADASSCHNELFGPGKSTEAGCWSHARRRFIAAFRAAEGAEPAAVLRMMQDLFRIERDIAGLDPAERLEIRTRKSAPLVDELLSIAATRRHELPSDSLTRKGFVYLDNQCGPLREFLRNGELPMHNNVSERELRRHVKGRINWLFHGSAEHAHSACAISSLVASAELQGLDPELYLQEILTVIGSYPANRVLDLSPDNWLETRARLIADGRLKYLDFARATGSALSLRPR